MCKASDEKVFPQTVHVFERWFTFKQERTIHLGGSSSIVLRSTMREEGRGQRYRLLDHTADAYVEVSAPNMALAFEEAAFAMFDIMTDPVAVEVTFVDAVDVSAQDRVSLLHNWLEELLLRFDLHGKVYSSFLVERLEERDQSLHLLATAKGGLFERGKHPAKVEVKAVTYHRMEVKMSENACTVRYILDL